MSDNSPTGKRGAGRPPRVNRATIADAALRIGLDKATLVLIGRELGVDHSSLYRHVRSRDDLMTAAVDQALDDVSWHRDADDDWRGYLARVAEAVWDVYEANPGVAETIRTLDAMPSSVIRAFVVICGELRTAGLSAADAVLAADSVMDMTNDSAVGWRRLLAPTATGPLVADKMRHALESEFAAHADWTEYGELMAGALTGSPKTWWRRKLELILDGIAVRQSAG
ncbi:TetR/AcrR family transcriptional regulator [Pleomorphomonas sp. PLEO]|uniref:TetR/AcrR family transcriptional regulator n=1 Tax=Pleomorphomonas sp. PLEO TaxID=3239306 RepID=UPI00351DDD40